jgi:hypothetical protein
VVGLVLIMEKVKIMEEKGIERNLVPRRFNDIIR